MRIFDPPVRPTSTTSSPALAAPLSRSLCIAAQYADNPQDLGVTAKSLINKLAENPFDTTLFDAVISTPSAAANNQSFAELLQTSLASQTQRNALISALQKAAESKLGAAPWVDKLVEVLSPTAPTQPAEDKTNTELPLVEAQQILAQLAPQPVTLKALKGSLFNLFQTNDTLDLENLSKRPSFAALLAQGASVLDEPVMSSATKQVTLRDLLARETTEARAQYSQTLMTLVRENVKEPSDEALKGLSQLLQGIRTPKVSPQLTEEQKTQLTAFLDKALAHLIVREPLGKTYSSADRKHAQDTAYQALLKNTAFRAQLDKIVAHPAFLSYFEVPKAANIEEHPLLVNGSPLYNRLAQVHPRSRQFLAKVLQVAYETHLEKGGVPAQEKQGFETFLTGLKTLNTQATYAGIKTQAEVAPVLPAVKKPENEKIIRNEATLMRDFEATPSPPTRPTPTTGWRGFIQKAMSWL